MSGVDIDSSFPGGNIILHEIWGDDVYLEQDLRDTPVDWFYWSFRVRGAPARTLRFHFQGSDAVGPLGPAVSTDEGRTWQWAGGARDATTTFTYRFVGEPGEVRFSTGIGYVGSNLADFVAKRPSLDRLHSETLCTSRHGRPVELLRIGDPERPRSRLVLTCRHHACEASASYVLEGVLTGMLDAQHVETLAVPFMDKDGVEEGDQGKFRRPHDHWWDYEDGLLYPEVAAVRTLLESFDDGTPLHFVDLHCPWLYGGRHETIHFVANAAEESWSAIQGVTSHLERSQSGPLPFAMADNLAFGVDWNVDRGSPLTSHNWVQTLASTRLATVIEFPYALVHGVAVDAAGARHFGADLAAALRAVMEPA
jgi:hypothetical protein